MRNSNVTFCFLIFLGILLTRSGLADVILISDLPGREAPVIMGDAEEADRLFSPASTFKMIISFNALTQGIADEKTTALCNDEFLPIKNMKLDFHRALFF